MRKRTKETVRVCGAPGMRRILLVALMLFAAAVFCVPQQAEASAKPDRVTVIKAEAGYDWISLKWQPARNAEKYIVYRANSKYGFYHNIKTVEDNQFVDKNLETGKAVWYKIRAINGEKRSWKSPRISAVPMLKSPQIKAETAGEGIYLTIGRVRGADGYVIYRDGKALSNQRSLTYLDNSVYSGKNHRYKVIAYRHVNQKVVPSEFSRELTATRPSVNLSLKGTGKLPDEIHEGENIEVKGKIRSNTTISKVIVGIINGETGKWVSEIRYRNSEINEMTFDIEEAAEKVRTEELPQSTYYYRVIAELKTGVEKQLINHSFEIIQPPGAQLIVDAALECAWPKGTSSSKYHYPSGSRVPAYTEALAKAYGSRSGWSAQTRAGASCDVFVGTVVRVSGYDKTFPRGLDEIESYCRKHSDKWEDTGITQQKDMQPGDLLYQLYSGGGGHIAVYLGDGLVANAHYHGKSFGVVQDMHNGGGISRSSWKTFKVYRPIQ